MQEYKIYSVRDSKGAAYAPPFYQASDAEAERMFRRLSLDPQSMVAQFPEDYDLFHLGTFDATTGQITPSDTPRHIMKALGASKVTTIQKNAVKKPRA